MTERTTWLRLELKSWVVGLAATVALIAVPGSKSIVASATREPTDEELALLDEAEGILVQQCMEDRGFKYWPAHTSGGHKSFAYVIDDVAWAHQHGYGSDLRIEAANAASPNQQYLEGLSPQQKTSYDIALRGDRRTVLEVHVPGIGTIGQSANGCVAEAQEQLYGNLATWFEADALAANLTGQYVDEVLGDPRYDRAEAKWAACMAGRDYPYATPTDVRDALPNAVQDLPAGRAHQVEVELAVAEAECARDSRLASTSRDLDRKYRATAPEEFRAAAVVRDRLRLGALDEAQLVVNNDIQVRRET